MNDHTFDEAMDESSMRATQMYANRYAEHTAMSVSSEAQAAFDQPSLRDFLGNPAGYGELKRRNAAESAAAAHAKMRGWQG